MDQFFKVVSWVFMVFGWFPWFFKVVSWFFMVFGWFPWFFKDGKGPSEKKTYSANKEHFVNKLFF